MTPDEAAAALPEAVEKLAQARAELVLVMDQEATARHRVLEQALNGGESVAHAERAAEYATSDEGRLRRKKKLEVDICEDRVAMFHTLVGRRVDY